MRAFERTRRGQSHRRLRELLSQKIDIFLLRDWARTALSRRDDAKADYHCLTESARGHTCGEMICAE